MTDAGHFKVKAPLATLGQAARTHIELVETIRRQMQPLAEAMRKLEVNPALQQLARETARREELLRRAVRPLKKLPFSKLLADTELAAERVEMLRALTVQYEMNFQLPRMAENIRLFNEIEKSRYSALSHLCKPEVDLRRAMESMRTPWLDMRNKVASLKAFATLQAIGHAVQNFQPFDDKIAGALRESLGDWRTRVNFPENIFDDLAARTRFYTERGLDTSLTAFPATAFEESLEIAGLADAPPAIVRRDPRSAGVITDNEKAGFGRTNVSGP